ncbi:MAG TPA: ABC transporter substrate-binding protein [Chloroflexota bacterium]|nr:ABC transporter substrate-binding protein [Chloroflexota bacterium]
MTRRSRLFCLTVGLVTAMAVLAACGPSTTRLSTSEKDSPPARETGRTKSITIGVTSHVGSMGNMLGSTTVGGWVSVNELHTNGLVTSDVHTRRPVGRLAERVPTVEDGSITVLPDGRMRVVYPIRSGVTWQDGAPFTAQDLVFSYRVDGDQGLPNNTRDAVNLIESVDAPDDQTFVINFRRPYYLGGTMGPRLFWPMPKHILQEAFDRYQESNNADDFLNLPYWTSEYVNTGPFRLTSFDPGDGMTFQAYDGYFLGRPKVDVVRVKLFADSSTLFSNVLAGTVDLVFESTLGPDLGFQLAEKWGGGNVYQAYVSHRMIAPQFRPSVQMEPATLDVRVRAALYHALDRDALSEALQGGHREYAAYAILPPQDLLYPAVKDGLRQYAFDPDRAKAILRDVGWTTEADGSLRNAVDGHRFHTAISASDLTVKDMPAYAAYWRQIGIDVDEITTPAAQVRNAEYRASYPGWEVTAQSGGDGILGKLEGPAASADTHWAGNRGGFDDPRAQRLVDAYRSSLSQDDQFQAMKAIGEYVSTELPFLVLYGTVDPLAVRKGVKALDDRDGGDSGGRPFGTYTRDAHLWDVE